MIDIKSTLLRSVVPTVKPLIPQAVESIERTIKGHIGEPLPDGVVRRVLMMVEAENGELYVMDGLIDRDGKIQQTENVKNAKKWLNETIDNLIK